MKNIILLSLFSLLLLFPSNLFAEGENNQGNQESVETIGDASTESRNNSGVNSDIFNKDLRLNSEIKVNTPLSIDLSTIQKKLETSLGLPLSFEWSMKGKTTKSGSSFSTTFESTGDKLINLDVFTTEDSEKKLLFTKNIHIFAYSSKTPIIFDKGIGKEKINQYIKKSLENGVFVENIMTINNDDIESQDIAQLLQESEKDQYLSIWGSKDFVFSFISKLNSEIAIGKNISEENPHYNIVVISPFNTDVVNNYLRNFLSNKEWITSILLLSEGSATQIKYSPDNIFELESKLLSNGYEYVRVNTKSRISDFFFISNFINTLSNNGFSTKSIYIILIIPFLFFGISVYKHLIGLSPIGSIIPISLTLLLFEIEILPATILMLFILLLNLGLSKITNKYTLLYAPKIAFIITINIVIILPVITALINYSLLQVTINDVIFMILFIIISERLITVILSKEFNEYKYNLFNTVLFAFISYFFLSIGTIQTVILAYPEIILILIPLNFTIGRFTGLRVTEYFRFKEVIKSIEE